MPDDGNKLVQIERGIDRAVADSMTIAHRGGGAVVMPTSMGELLEFSKLMSVSGICIRPAFRGNPGACLAITMQAMKWGADPFAVANKAYEVNNQLAYEAQLIHAIVNSSPVLAKRLRPHYEGEGQTRRCRIVGYIVGEDEAFEYESPAIKDITIKNSPLWKSDPDQQLFYFSTRAWARRHVPEILLGIYTPDEFQGATIEMEPQPEPRREDFAPPEHLRETGRYYDVTDLDGEVHAFSDADKAASALRVVLSDASRRDAETLDEAWGLNEDVIGSFGERARSELAREYIDLRERVLQTAERAAEAARRQETLERGTAAEPEWKPDDAGVDDGEAPATASGGSEGEAETRRTAAAEPQQGGPVPEPTGKPAEPHREPGGIPGPAEQPSQAGFRSVAAPVERPEQGEGDSSPQPSPARDERAADRKSLLIPVPLKAGTGKPDPRTWAVALFLPKLRRQTDGNDLAWLLGDNAEAVEACRNGGLSGDDLREFEAAIKAAWERCK